MKPKLKRKINSKCTHILKNNKIILKLFVANLWIYLKNYIDEIDETEF